jgi:predicted nucleic acid-binding protein
MDLADATLMTLAEELKLARIFTMDYKRFRIYRPLHLKRLELLPPKLPGPKRTK